MKIMKDIHIIFSHKKRVGNRSYPPKQTNRLD